MCVVAREIWAGKEEMKVGEGKERMERRKEGKKERKKERRGKEFIGRLNEIDIDGNRYYQFIVRMETTSLQHTLTRC